MTTCLGTGIDIFATPRDKKMWNSHPRLFFERAGEGACSTFSRGFLTIKPAAK
jgi:hypothetical protein